MSLYPDPSENSIERDVEQSNVIKIILQTIFIWFTLMSYANWFLHEYFVALFELILDILRGFYN